MYITACLSVSGLTASSSVPVTARCSPGRGHLACVHYSGNKAFSNRRPLYKELSIRDDVNLLSFYAKNRLAAAGLAGEKATGTLDRSRLARTRFAPRIILLKETLNYEGLVSKPAAGDVNTTFVIAFIENT